MTGFTKIEHLEHYFDGLIFEALSIYWLQSIQWKIDTQTPDAGQGFLHPFLTPCLRYRISSGGFSYTILAWGIQLQDFSARTIEQQ